MAERRWNYMDSLTKLGDLVKGLLSQGIISKPIEAHVQEPVDFYK